MARVTVDDTNGTPRAARGFTLLEMMIVMVLIAIGTVVALPRVRAMIVRQQVDRTSQVIASDIRSAFTSAARGRIPVRLTVTPSTKAYSVVNRVTGDTILRRAFSTGDLGVAGVTGSVLTIDVFPNGVAAGADTVTITGAGGYTRTISVSRVGFVRVVPYTGP